LCQKAFGWHQQFWMGGEFGGSRTSAHSGGAVRLEWQVSACAVGVTAQFSADRRGRATDCVGDGTHRLAGVEAVGDLDAFGLGEEPRRDRLGG
jgi:hypothetical protein